MLNAFDRNFAIKTRLRLNAYSNFPPKIGNFFCEIDGSAPTSFDKLLHIHILYI